jgi:hypothetical protein
VATDLTADDVSVRHDSNRAHDPLVLFDYYYRTNMAPVHFMPGLQQRFS